MRFICFLQLLIFQLGIATATTPGGIQWYFSDPAQMGMGFTGVANTTAISAASFNPAAMPFCRSSGIQVGFSVLRPATSFLETSPSVYLDTTLLPTLTPLFLNTIIRLQKLSPSKPLSIGVSVHQPFGVSVTWPDAWKGKYIAQEFSLNTYLVQISTAIQLSEQLGISIGSSYGALTLLSRRALENTDGQQLDAGSATLSGSDVIWGMQAGLCYQASDKSSFSLLFRSPMQVNIRNGIADFSVPASLEHLYPSQRFSSSFWLPPQIDLGVSLKPKPRLTIQLAANLVGWKVMDSLWYQLEEPVESLNQYPRTGFINSLSVRMGSELFLSEHVSCRGGIYLENSPATEESLSPEFPDAARIGLCSGLGYQSGSIRLDAAYQVAFTGERTGILSTAGFGGTYKSSIQSLSLGLTYLW